MYYLFGFSGLGIQGSSAGWLWLRVFPGAGGGLEDPLLGGLHHLQLVSVPPQGVSTGLLECP
jgi:hypothetical protein